ncbi:7TM-DISM domain-containing protein [Desulfovibrio litoralis]|uniref:Response regulator receiver domain-containing protein n=1 Tax=Desulfovibrio litoralis DSM 11393 TaxID=1121455 RepID=A0A1M7T7D3_9BACT|nr:7TM-DISM domain-containing protein [Desulfovibrio litoralis]SHN66623.1 Response regulator receiver domain-containing protein [Desulfovibrio litoralis DSM 11393]
MLTTCFFDTLKITNKLKTYKLQKKTSVLLIVICSLLLNLSFFKPLQSADVRQGTMPLVTDQIQTESALTPYLSYFFDQSGLLGLSDISTSKYQGRFLQLSEGVPFNSTGVFWLRLTLLSSTPENQTNLGVNLGPNLPEDKGTVFTPQINDNILGSSSVSWKKLEFEGSPTFNLPLAGIDPTTVYIRLEGVTNPWFSPTVYPANIGDNNNSLFQLILLGIVLFSALIAFTRSILQRSTEKVWVGFYAILLFINIYMPTIPTTTGTLSIYSIPFVIAPGLALLILAHINIIRINTPINAPFSHFFFKLFTWIGAIIALLPLIPGLAWTTNYLSFWSVLILPIFFFALICTLNKIKYSATSLLALFPPFITVLLSLYFLYELQSAPSWSAYLPALGTALGVLILSIISNANHAEQNGQGGQDEKEYSKITNEEFSNDEINTEELDNAYRLNFNNSPTIEKNNALSIQDNHIPQENQPQENLELTSNSQINFSDFNKEDFLNRIPNEYKPYLNTEETAPIVQTTNQEPSENLGSTTMPALSLGGGFDLNNLGDNILEELQQIKQKTEAPTTPVEPNNVYTSQPQTTDFPNSTPSIQTEANQIPQPTATLSNFPTIEEKQEEQVVLNEFIPPKIDTQIDIPTHNQTDDINRFQNNITQETQKPIRVIKLVEDFDEPLAPLLQTEYQKEIPTIQLKDPIDFEENLCLQPKENINLDQGQITQTVPSVPSQTVEALYTSINELLRNLIALSTHSQTPSTQPYIDSALKNSQDLLKIAESLGVKVEETYPEKTPVTIENITPDTAYEFEDSTTSLQETTEFPDLNKANLLETSNIQLKETTENETTEHETTENNKKENEEEYKVFDIYKLLSEIHKEFLPLAQNKSLGLSWFASPRLHHRFAGDGDKLKQILADLLEASLSASTGGNVQLSARLAPIGNDPGFITFTINDTRPFNSRYDQSDNQAELNAIKFAHALGGTFNTTTNQHNGTAVTFNAHFTPITDNHKKTQTDQVVPNVSPTQNQSEIAPRVIQEINTIKNNQSLPTQEDTVLIIDMASGSRKTIAKILGQHNIKNIEARFIGDAVNICNETIPTLIILNADLPESDIKHFISEINIGREIPVLALAINQEQKQRLEAMGCQGVVLKPLNEIALTEAVFKLTPNLFPQGFQLEINKETTEESEKEIRVNTTQEIDNTTKLSKPRILSASIKVSSIPANSTPTTTTSPAEPIRVQSQVPETATKNQSEQSKSEQSEGLTLLNSMLENAFTPDKDSSVALNSLPVTEIRQAFTKEQETQNLRLIQIPGLEQEGIEPELIPLLPGFITDIQEALSDAADAKDNGSSIDVQESVMRIAGKAQSFGLNKLEGIAACVSRAAAADDLEAVGDLMLELENTTNKYIEALASLYQTKHAQQNKEETTL